MSRFENQPHSSTFPGPRSILLAPKVPKEERERLWFGLERFVNCGDALEDFRALGCSFPKFWPASIWCMNRDFQWWSLDWHPECHELFLLYRNTLRRVWRNDFSPEDWGQAEFLLGIKEWKKDLLLQYLLPGLSDAWKKISAYGPREPEPCEVKILWKDRTVCIEPKNEFQLAFYLLFQDSWRARVCPNPGCTEMYFIAVKPKQKFCGDGCSAASRRASNLGWWKREGAQRRAEQAKAASQRNRRKRRSL